MPPITAGVSPTTQASCSSEPSNSSDPFSESQPTTNMGSGRCRDHCVSAAKKICQLGHISEDLADAQKIKNRWSLKAMSS